MRGLELDRIPCVQAPVRNLGLNFTDWLAPFFSVRILTRKVASAEPLYRRVPHDLISNAIFLPVVKGNQVMWNSLALTALTLAHQTI